MSEGRLRSRLDEPYSEEVNMSVNKGKGTKGRNYDELSGVGTSRAGVTGIKDTLSDLRSEAALDTDWGDTGSMQSADLGPAEENQASSSGARQGQQNRQSGQGSGSASGELPPQNPGIQRGSQNR
jgi:hypothetical protein